MARPKRPSKTSSPSPSSPSLPGVALSLFAAVAAGFFASRAFKRRSHNRVRSPDSVHLASPAVEFPDLLQALPNRSPSSSPSHPFLSQNDDPVVEVVVRQEIVRDLQDKVKDQTIDEVQLPVAELRAVVSVEKDVAADSNCSTAVNGIGSPAVECNLEFESLPDIHEDVITRELYVKSPKRMEQRAGNDTADDQVEDALVSADFKDGEEGGRHFEEIGAVLENSVEPDISSTHSMQGSSEERKEELSSSEQSPVHMNCEVAKSFSEVDSEEENEKFSSGSSPSDCTGGGFDSEDSSQEVTSAAVKPLDPSLVQGENSNFGSRCAVVPSSKLNLSTKNCSDGQGIGDGAETPEAVKEFLVKVDCNVNSDEDGGAALISPNFNVTIKLPGNKQSYSIGCERGEIQESIGSVSSNFEVYSQLSDYVEKSDQSGQQMPATRAFDEFQESTLSILATPKDASKGKIFEKNKDINGEIINAEAGLEVPMESVDARADFAMRESDESFVPEKNLKEIHFLERNSINEGTLPPDDELDRCSDSGADRNLRSYTESSDREEESTAEIEMSNTFVASSTETQHLSSNFTIGRDVWANGEIQSNPKDVVSVTTASELEEKQQTKQIFEIKNRSIEDLNLKEKLQCCTEVSGDVILASTTGKHLFSADLSTVNRSKRLLTGFAMHIPIAMTLIGVLIGVLSIVLLVLRIHDSRGVISQK